MIRLPFYSSQPNSLVTILESIGLRYDWVVDISVWCIIIWIVAILIGLPLAILFKTYEPSIKANDPRYAYHPDYKKSWKKLYNKIFGDK